MQFTTLAISALALVSSVVAAPAPAQKRDTGSGQATYFYQNGVAGSCGSVHSDSTPIVAVNSAQMNSDLCGKSVWIKGNGKTIEAKVADTCPTCDWGSLDLSVGAFSQLSGLDAGVVPITWWT